MGKNARRRIMIFLTILTIALQSCQVKQTELIKEKHQNQTVERLKSLQPNMDSINVLLALISDSTCGKVITNNSHLSVLLDNNMEIFNCIRSDKSSNAYKQYKKALNKITPLVNYESNTEFIRFFGYIKEFDDVESFEIAIELLKYEYQPEEGSDVFFNPEFKTAYNQLLMSKIYSINGIEFNKSPEYRKMKEMLYPLNICKAEDFYTYFKELWTTGKIVLKSQVKE